MSQQDNNNNETPIWKSDFPIKKEEATHVSRREFAKYLCLLSGSLAIGNGLIAGKSLLFSDEHSDEEFFICNSSEIPVGEMRTFVLKENRDVPYILIHLEEEKWRAFEEKCTHLSCAVRYRHDMKKIECPCHKGYFDAENGEVLQGPPPRALPQLAVRVHEDKIYVSKIKKA